MKEKKKKREREREGERERDKESDYEKRKQARQKEDRRCTDSLLEAYIIAHTKKDFPQTIALSFLLSPTCNTIKYVQKLRKPCMAGVGSLGLYGIYKIFWKETKCKE